MNSINKLLKQLKIFEEEYDIFDEGLELFKNPKLEQERKNEINKAIKQILNAINRIPKGNYILVSLYKLYGDKENRGLFICAYKSNEEKPKNTDSTEFFKYRFDPKLKIKMDDVLEKLRSIPEIKKYMYSGSFVLKE